MKKLKRRRTVSDSSTEDLTTITTTTTVTNNDINQRKPTMLLAGPKFRYHTAESIYDPKRDTIYPISVCIKTKYCTDYLHQYYILSILIFC